MSLCRSPRGVVEINQSMRLQGCDNLKSFVLLAILYLPRVAGSECSLLKPHHTDHSPRIDLVVCKTGSLSAKQTSSGSTNLIGLPPVKKN